MSRHHGVEASNGGQRNHVVDKEPDDDDDPRIGRSQFLGVRITHLEQRHVVLPKLPDVRVGGGGHGARYRQAPYGHGHGDSELGGPAAAHGGVQLAHRVHDGEEPVSAQGGQCEHGHADRYVLGGL